MKLSKLTYTLLVPILCASMSVMAQDSTARAFERQMRNDSLTRVQQKKNSDNLSDLKSERTDSRAKAKEARRVERNANDAARESETAYRSERKAQKARSKADKQARKASRARVKSGKD